MKFLGNLTQAFVGRSFQAGSRKSRTRAITTIAVVGFTAALALSASVCQAEDDKCRVLVDTKCTECHYKTRICEKLGKKRKSAWKATIKRMVKTHGAKITNDEQNDIAECLYDLSPGSQWACKDAPSSDSGK